MKVFFGAAIQGKQDRVERLEINTALIQAIKDTGSTVASEHVLGTNFNETTSLLEQTLGKLPPAGMERTVMVRNKMIEFIEGDIDAAIFEVSIPSLGTGIEIAHAYLRPRMNLKEIPILALYQKDYWPNNLSSMIRGLTPESAPSLVLKEYSAPEEAKRFVSEFLHTVARK
jgi:hypothetical protein